MPIFSGKQLELKIGPWYILNMAAKHMTILNNKDKWMN
jgi:hypothetical protein